MMAELLRGEIVLVEDSQLSLCGSELQSRFARCGFDIIPVSGSSGLSFNLLKKSLLKGGSQELLFLLSLDFSEESPFELLEDIQISFPKARIAFFASNFNPEQIEECFAQGVSALFSKYRLAEPLHTTKLLAWATNKISMAVDIVDAGE